MKVSKRGEYGVRALCHLARRYGDGWVHIRRVAEDEAIPAKFLEGILLHLKRAGFVTSRRGTDGGYSLSRSPAEVRLGDVIRVLDGPLAPMASAAELRQLMERNPGQQGFYALLMDVRDAVSGILDRTTLADVIERGTTAPPSTSDDLPDEE